MTPEEAFDGHHQAVYRFAYRLTRRPDVAEDITQECFLALVRAPERFDAARGTMLVYLFAIARNLALKYYRRQHATELVDEDAEPAAIVDPRETLDVGQAVATAVSGLPPLQREALVLFEYEGATLEEIAQIVAADVGTVKSRLHRARERLRRSLAGYRPGDRKVANGHGTV
jgi:RNA polymerase sigma factor (sigma-70 family)